MTTLSVRKVRIVLWNQANKSALQEIMQHIVYNEGKIFFTPHQELSTMCNQLQCDKKQQQEHIEQLEAQLWAPGPERGQRDALERELSLMKGQANQQPAKDAFLQDQFAKQEVTYQNMLAKLNNVTLANNQLTQSVARLQTLQLSTNLQQVSHRCCCF